MLQLGGMVSSGMAGISCSWCGLAYHSSPACQEALRWPTVTMMTCVMCHVSCVMCHVSCHVSCVMCHVSCVMCHVSCVMCHVSRVMCHVSCVTCHVSRVMCHMSCVTCHVVLQAGPGVRAGGALRADHAATLDPQAAQQGPRPGQLQVVTTTTRSTLCVLCQGEDRAAG